jgi:hypothetical protein
MGKMGLVKNGQYPGKAGPWLGNSLMKPQAAGLGFGPIKSFI